MDFFLSPSTPELEGSWTIQAPYSEDMGRIHTIIEPYKLYFWSDY